MTGSQADRLFPGERERLAAIRDLDRMMGILEAQSEAFHRKARAAETGWALGLPPRLYRAMETILYDPNVRRRKMAGRLIMEWARHG